MTRNSQSWFAPQRSSLASDLGKLQMKTPALQDDRTSALPATSRTASETAPFCSGNFYRLITIPPPF